MGPFCLVDVTIIVDARISASAASMIAEADWVYFSMNMLHHFAPLDLMPFSIVLQYLVLARWKFHPSHPSDASQCMTLSFMTSGRQ